MNHLTDQDDITHTTTLLSKLNEWNYTKKDEAGFEYYVGDKPKRLLNWAIKNNFLLHGSTQKIELLEPRQANDAKKESGNKIAIYMGDDVTIAIFMALVGGTDASGNTSFHKQTRTSSDDIEKTNYQFSVDNPRMIHSSGYVYIFTRNQAEKFIDGEYHSYKPQKPVATIKIHRSDLNQPVDILSQQQAELRSTRNSL